MQFVCVCVCVRFDCVPTCSACHQQNVAALCVCVCVLLSGVFGLDPLLLCFVLLWVFRVICWEEFVLCPGRMESICYTLRLSLFTLSLFCSVALRFASCIHLHPFSVYLFAGCVSLYFDNHVSLCRSTSDQIKIAVSHLRRLAVTPFLSLSRSVCKLLLLLCIQCVCN